MRVYLEDEKTGDWYLVREKNGRLKLVDVRTRRLLRSESNASARSVHRSADRAQSRQQKA
jgi:hypothetical protein